MPVCRLTTGQCLLRSANGSLSSSRTPSSRGEKKRLRDEQKDRMRRKPSGYIQGHSGNSIN